MVRPDLDVCRFRQSTTLTSRTHIEADDRGPGGGGQLDVVFSDGTNGAMHETDLDFGPLELLERLSKGFKRTLDIGLDEQVERGLLAALNLLEQVFELDAATDGRRRAPQTGEPETLFASLGHRLGGLQRRGGTEIVARTRHLRQTEHLDRHRRPGFFNLFAPIVDKRTNGSPRSTGDDGIANL